MSSDDDPSQAGATEETLTPVGPRRGAETNKETALALSPVATHDESGEEAPPTALSTMDESETSLPRVAPDTLDLDGDTSPSPPPRAALRRPSGGRDLVSAPPPRPRAAPLRASPLAGRGDAFESMPQALPRALGEAMVDPTARQRRLPGQPVVRALTNPWVGRLFWGAIVLALLVLTTLYVDGWMSGGP